MKSAKHEIKVFFQEMCSLLFVALRVGGGVVICLGSTRRRLTVVICVHYHAWGQSLLDIQRYAFVAT